ncbi:hypothetical protein JCGZ_08927 [Jatropha curcas]|uniref:Uncharacterized protein n=1 Tax=Jatropha curcas TaxID=180498 RepID=A0A067LQR6_JATCU|nr:hypothetical protein JCGZ_08927 [Jatropha curcas]
MAADLMWMDHYEDLQASFGERWLVLGGLLVEEFTWESDVTEAMFKKAWETQLVDRYSDFLYKMRSTGKKQSLNEMSGEGAGPSRHTDGSISAAEITKKLVKKLNRQPTSMEVFTFTYTKDYDRVTLIDRRAELVRVSTIEVSTSRATPVEPEARTVEIQDLQGQLKAQQQ